MTRTLKVALFLLFAACIFDPADKLLGAKVYLFIGCWCLALASCALRRDRCYIDVGLLRYMLLFLLVPVVSIAWYFGVDGGERFEGWQLLKGYLLVTLAALLFIQRIDAMPQLAGLLTALSVAVIGVFIAVFAVPSLEVPLHLFGNTTGILYLDRRDYGSGLVLTQVYFATSPMLSVSIAHYFRAAKMAATGLAKWLNYTAMGLSVAAMPLAGTRNNIAIAVFLPLILVTIYARNKVLSGVACTVFALAFVLVFFDDIAVLLNPLEFSNNLKLALMDDYAAMLSNPWVLLFGKGLGSYDYWTPRGLEYFVTELTYLEIIRNFGLIGGLVMIGLLVWPLAYAFVVRPSFDQKHLVAAYGFYLIMSASNPTLFSSMGILILSVVLANIFLFEDRIRAPERRDLRAQIPAAVSA